jgi:hypothetical protein
MFIIFVACQLVGGIACSITLVGGVSYVRAQEHAASQKRKKEARKQAPRRYNNEAAAA